MIHSLFGSNRPPVFSLLIIPAILYGIFTFQNGEMPVHPLGGPLFDLLNSYLQLPILSIIAGLIVNLIGAFLINLLYNEHDYAERVNYFPALIYFLLASLQTSWVFLNPVLIGNIFVLLALRRMLRMYRVQEITSMIFDAGLFLALGALFFPLLVLVFPLLWLGLSQLRTFNFREWIVPLVGLLTPIFFTVVAFWWLDYTLEIEEFIRFSKLEVTGLFVSHGFWYLPLLLLSLFILFAGFIIFVRDMNNSTVHKQNTKKVFITATIFMIIVCLYGIGLENTQPGIFASLAFPVSVYSGVYFSPTRRKKLRLILFYIWISFLFFYPVLASGL